MAGKITLKDVRALPQNGAVWDRPGLDYVAGFGARRQRSEAVAYVVMYRTAEGRLRRYTIGRHGAPWTPDSAREEARRVLHLARKGADPAAEKQKARRASTVSELCDVYIRDAEAGRLLTRQGAAKKPSTLATDMGRIERHIKPLLGNLIVGAVTRDDIERFMHSVAEGRTAKRENSGKLRGVTLVKGGKGTASRTVGLLGGIFSYAVRKGIRADNPVQGVARFADGRRERRLTDAEYRALGSGLEASADMWPPAIVCIRFLALTGWRSGEALGLSWSSVDLERRTATLVDTKTGRSIRPLSQAACDLLRALPRTGPLVFIASRGSGHMSGLPKFFAKIAAAGGLPSDVTPHVLRHSFASLASDLGFSEPTIAALIGHKGHSVTSRYVHSADTVLLAAADVVASTTAKMMRLEHEISCAVSS